jgi:hypothetical protein
MAAQASVYALCWIAFIGFPCPKKNVGMVGPARSAFVVSSMSDVRFLPKAYPGARPDALRGVHLRRERKTCPTDAGVRCLEIAAREG